MTLDGRARDGPVAVACRVAASSRSGADVSAVQRPTGGRGQSDREPDEVDGGIEVVVDLDEASESTVG